MIVVYIAGPFRGANAWEVERHAQSAEVLAYEVWALGMVALCPHNNTRHFDGVLNDGIWLSGDLELLGRCDAILMVPGWETSIGAMAERTFALTRGIPVYDDLNNLARDYERQIIDSHERQS